MQHNIQFEINDNIQSSKSIIYILNSIEDINTDILSTAEIEYVKRRVDDDDYEPELVTTDGCKFILINKELEDADELNEKTRRQAFKILKKLRSGNITSVTLITSINKSQTLAFIEGLLLSSYTFNKYKSEQKDTNPIKVVINAKQISRKDLDTVVNVAEGVFIARNLVNEPGNSLNALKLSAIIEELGKKHNFAVTTLHQKEIEAEKMGGLLGVNQGSVTPPTFTILEWKHPQATAKPTVIIGKGVTFDTGGINLKVQPGSLDDMKSDMAGAAAVVGTFVAAATNNLPIHLIGLIPATDNRPGKEALVPGDVITMHDGTTVEIMNTDAEGRLILADAISYAKKYDPQLIMELSTLTGSTVMTLSDQGIAAMGTADKETFNRLEQTGDQTHERIAHFPFWSEYGEMIKSDIADLKNIGGREAGAITAGKFLSHFTTYPFIHLDIAGVAFARKDNGYKGNGASGSGVRLFHRFLSSAKNND